MLESGSSGSVRGASSNGRPYREPRPRPCENMISDAGIVQQRWFALAGGRGQAAIACISGLTPASFEP